MRSSALLALLVPLARSSKDFRADVKSLEDSFGINAKNAQVPGLWVAQAAQLIPQLERIAESYTGSKGATVRVSLPVRMASAHPVAALKLALERHGSDKHNKAHNYTMTYSQILHILGRKAALRVLEVGMGTNKTTGFSTMGAKGRPGASLRAWRDYLPNAAVFGCDIDEAILFNNEPRIRTTRVDQLDFDFASFLALYGLFGGRPFDLLIDDGLHALGSSLNTLTFALGPAVRPGGFIVIEDIASYQVPAFRTVDALLRSNPALRTYLIKPTTTPPTKKVKNYLYVVHKCAAAASGLCG